MVCMNNVAPPTYFSQSYIIDFSLIFDTIATAPAPLSVSLPPLSSLP
jgi:hypothetical protein